MIIWELLSLHTHIGLDIDDTLTNTMEDWLAKFHKDGKLLHIKDVEGIRFFEWSESIFEGITKEEYMEFWWKHSLSELPPYTDAQKWVQTFIKHGKILSVITARNEVDHKKDASLWIEKHFPEIQENNIYFANHQRGWSIPKSEICKKYGITLMIDDAFHNAVDLIENDITCILLEKPWNREKILSHPLLYRVKDWNEIITQIS